MRLRLPSPGLNNEINTFQLNILYNIFTENFVAFSNYSSFRQCVHTSPMCAHLNRVNGYLFTHLKMT